MENKRSIKFYYTPGGLIEYSGSMELEYLNGTLIVNKFNVYEH